MICVLCTDLLQLSKEGFQVATEGLEVDIDVTGADCGQSSCHGLVVSKLHAQEKLVNQVGNLVVKPVMNPRIAALSWQSTSPYDATGNVSRPLGTSVHFTGGGMSQCGVDCWAPLEAPPLTAMEVTSASTAFHVIGEMRPTMPKSMNPTLPSGSTSRLPAINARA